jgi:hypothetical protein
MPAGERVEADRGSGTIRVVSRERPDDEVMVHPLLGLPAAIHGVWRGWLALHGGAFLAGGGAWGLLGDRGAGKSTSLAQLLALGHVVLSDDLLLVEGRTVYSGPRSIDLRAEAAAYLGGERMGIIGSRERWRLHPNPAPPAAPLCGFVKLEWGDTVTLVPLDTAERLALLYEGSAIYPTERSAAALLELVVLPAWRLVRPRGLRENEAAMSQLLARLER